MTSVAITAPLCRNYINGRWVESRSTQTLERRNPADLSEVLSVSPLSTRAEVGEAVAAAKAAFPAWRDTPAPTRGKILARAAALMEKRKEELARTLTREEGKTLKESLVEMQRSINILEFTAGEGRRIGGETVPSETPRNLTYTIKQPLGVVGAITPWNFPVAIPVWKAAPALVAGNTMVIKPAELTPQTCAQMCEIFEQAGLPAGVLNMVLGAGEEVGDELLRSPDVRAISFTGSNEIGGLIYATAAKQMKKCQCEMGGKNPVVVLKDADLALAADSVVAGAFGSSGQRCTATSRVVVEESIANQFVEMLVERAKKLKVGNGLDAATDIGPLVDEQQLKTVLRYIKTGKHEATLLHGGSRAGDGGYFVAPTIFDHVPWDSTIAQEEIFGPVLSVIRVPDFEEALRVANSVKYGLSSSIYTNDAARIFEFIDRIESGMTHVNAPTVVSEAQMPFGGVKATGVGLREMGRVAIDFYTELKAVYIDYTPRKPKS
ncbi:MAG TPA: aldehyde dehydrogenase family protein [Candidatus Acidoferrales bacterium]|jgi:aldehyde dehydrogenase (NAD+)|nr:aldehyde dehydrogenase family protein [Candidatus Acidoferrales bacterium]